MVFAKPTPPSSRLREQQLRHLAGGLLPLRAHQGVKGAVDLDAPILQDEAARDVAGLLRHGQHGRALREGADAGGHLVQKIGYHAVPEGQLRRGLLGQQLVGPGHSRLAGALPILR